VDLFQPFHCYMVKVVDSVFDSYLGAQHCKPNYAKGASYTVLYRMGLLVSSLPNYIWQYVTHI